MNSDGKKISFGFSKLSKKANVLVQPPKHEKSVELIDFLEGAEIKVKNVVENVEKAPLIIPIKGDANGIVSQIERESLKNRKIRIEVKNEDSRPDYELTIEELAARQLIREARNKLAQNKDTTKVHTLPLEDNENVQDGKEPSMGDYEDVPIEDFGLACLRGMGWKEGMSIGKNQSKFVKPPEPDLRPKGLGLGAQKMIDTQAKEVFDQNGKKLVLAKGAFGKIVAGPHKGKLCEVQFCDEWSGRVSIKTSNTNEILTLNELFVVPISKEEFILGSKVINNAKYEQYKQKNETRMKSNESSEDKMDNYGSSADEKYHRDSGETIINRKSRTRRERKQVKVEYDNSYDDCKKAEISQSYEIGKSRVLSHSKSRGGNRDNYRRSRSRGKTCEGNTSKFERNSSAESTSSAYDGEKFDNINSKTENKRHKSEELHKKDSRIKKRRTSEGSSEEYYRRKTKTRDASSNSSSESYKNSKEKSPIGNSKYAKAKKGTRRYLSVSSYDYNRSDKASELCIKNRDSEKDKLCDDKSRWKRNENKNHRERRGSFSKEKSCDDKSRRKGNERKNHRKRRESSSEGEKSCDDASRRIRTENKNNRKRRDSSSEEEEPCHDKRRRKRNENKNHRKRRDSSSSEEEPYDDEKRRQKTEYKNHRKRRNSSSEEEKSCGDKSRRDRNQNKNNRRRRDSSSCGEMSGGDKNRRKRIENKNSEKRRDSSSE